MAGAFSYLGLVNTLSPTAHGTPNQRVNVGLQKCCEQIVMRRRIGWDGQWVGFSLEFGWR
jgi:hypothetical protein